MMDTPPAEEAIYFDLSHEPVGGNSRIYINFYDAGIFSIEVKRNELEKLFIQLSDYLKMPAPLTQAPCGSNPGECIIKMDKQVKEARQDEREKANKIFDHTRALCDAIIERFDCQSKLGFNAMLIKRDIESLRVGKDGEGND